MILQFDCGNSSIKWRAVEAGRTLDAGRFGPTGAIPDVIYASANACHQIQVASVASDEFTVRLMEQLQQLKVESVVLAESQAAQIGLTNGYRDPSKMGVDRWLAMLGAWSDSRDASIVVDAGSAVTIDVIEADGQHKGGYILPGRELLLGGLQSGTSRVLFDTRESRNEALGADTQECVANGIFFLYRGLVQQIHTASYQHEVTNVWITGGGASYLRAAGLKGNYARDLVLDGLGVYCANLPPGTMGSVS